MKKAKQFILFALLIFTSISCVKDLDFDQADDFVIEPEVKASLVFFEFQGKDFFDPSNNEITEISDESFIDIIKEEMVKAELEFEITNPFLRNFSIEYEFFDNANNLTLALPIINIPANSSAVKTTRVIDITNEPQFLNSKKIRVTLRMDTTAGSAIDQNDLSKFIFKSAGTFTLKFD